MSNHVINRIPRTGSLLKSEYVEFFSRLDAYLKSYQAAREVSEHCRKDSACVTVDGGNAGKR